MRHAGIVRSVAHVKRDKIRFANFTHYRGSRQGLVQARTLTCCSRKYKNSRFETINFKPAIPM